MAVDNTVKKYYHLAIYNVYLSTNNENGTIFIEKSSYSQAREFGIRSTFLVLLNTFKVIDG